MSAGYLPAAVGNGGQAAVVDGAAYIGLGEAGEVGGLGDGEHERVGLALRSSGQLEELLEHGIGSKTGRGQGLAASEGGSDVGAIERGGAFLGGGFGHDDGIGGGEDAVDVGGIEDGLGLLTGAEAIGPRPSRWRRSRVRALICKRAHVWSLVSQVDRSG